MSKLEKITWGKIKTLEEWRKLRDNVQGVGKDYVRLGASDVATVMGVGYSCPARLFYKLLGLHDSFQTSASTVAGHQLEPVIADKFMGYNPSDMNETFFNWENGIKLRKVKKANFFVVNPLHPHLFASLDFVPVGKVYSPLTGERYAPLTSIECKATKSWVYKTWEDGLPMSHKIQLHAQMITTNTNLAVHNVLIDGYEYVVQEVERDNELCSQIIYETKKFTDLLFAGKIAVDGLRTAKTEKERESFQEYLDMLTPEPISDDDVKLYQEMNDEDNGLEKLSDDSEDDLMGEYLQLGDHLKEVKNKQDVVKANLLKSLEDYEVLKGEKHKMVYKRGADRKPYFRVSKLNKK